MYALIPVGTRKGFKHFGLKDQLIKKGDRIGQGIFLPYLVADNDEGGKETRTGGFGSSGK